jgi:hypothetical protein
MKIDEIRERISSGNREVLKQSLAFIVERISNERVRASKAETRAVATLAFSGVLSGIVVVKLPNILQYSDSDSWILAFVLYVTTIVFLLKSVVFSLQALGVFQGNEITPELIFELQDKSEIDALREEVVYKIWEYYQLLPIGTARLFRVNRAQRNILASIVAFLVLGVVWLVSEEISLAVTEWFNIVVIFSSILALLLLDFIVESWNSFWYWS